jgi:hypothetical protein
VCSKNLEVLLGAEVQKVLIANANGRGDHKPQAYGVVYYNSDGARKEVQRHRQVYFLCRHTHRGTQRLARGQIYESADRDTQAGTFT